MGTTATTTTAIHNPCLGVVLITPEVDGQKVGALLPIEMTLESAYRQLIAYGSGFTQPQCKNGVKWGGGQFQRVLEIHKSREQKSGEENGKDCRRGYTKQNKRSHEHSGCWTVKPLLKSKMVCAKQCRPSNIRKREEMAIDTECPRHTR